MSPTSLPSIDELTRYTSVVLVDVDRRDLSDGQVADLTAAVSDLGRGMVVVGGTHAYALGGYRNSDLEEILPVVSEITDPLRRQTVAEVLAIDSSGSMGACHCDEEGLNGLGGGNRIGGGVSKTAIARTAAARAIAALEATDEVGVLTMDASDRWVIDLQASPPQDVIDDGLAQVVPDGPTFINTGLLTAADELRASDASLKHIIFFSDGFTEPGAMAEMTDQAAALFEEGITVSVVATGEGAADDLRPIAEAGGGRYYPGRNLDEIPDLIVQEAVIASRDFVNEGEFFPLVSSNRGVAAALTESPALRGYVATTAKPTAAVDLAIGPDEDPLLASWQAGLGRVTAWTSDGGERWAAPWNGWADGPGLLDGRCEGHVPGRRRRRRGFRSDRRWSTTDRARRRRRVGRRCHRNRSGCRPRRVECGGAARANRRVTVRGCRTGRRCGHLRDRGGGCRRRRDGLVGNRADHPLLSGRVCAATGRASPARGARCPNRGPGGPEPERVVQRRRHRGRPATLQPRSLASPVRRPGLAGGGCGEPAGVAAGRAG